MTNRWAVWGLGILAMTVGLGTAGATLLPVSTCTAPDQYDLTCSLYPSDSNGYYSGDTFISYPSNEAPTTAGYLVLLFPGDALNTANEQNEADWEQVVEFVGNVSAGTESTLIQLFTNGCSSGNAGDTSCFPSLSTVEAGINGVQTYYDNQCSAAGQTQGDGDTCPGAGEYLWYPDEPPPTLVPPEAHEYDIFTVAAAQQVGTVPEPGTIGMLAIGAGALAGLGYRRKVRAGAGKTNS